LLCLCQLGDWDSCELCFYMGNSHVEPNTSPEGKVRRDTGAARGVFWFCFRGF
jgi:hypothetical protein